jgi:type I restriction-modification system DNA methylase subunit
MAKFEGPSLYEQQELADNRRLRRQHALFIPKFLHEAARNSNLYGEAQDKAHALAVRWADLESSGDLAKHKEVSIATQFLTQIFGEGLGYLDKTVSPGGWHIEREYAVSGVGSADAALGDFPKSPAPAAVIELKDANTDLDRDRSNGRSAVQQCWDYLNATPDCPWGIVSNFKTIRLYHRTKGALAYEEFSLQELRIRQRFDEFYCLFERGGLLPVNQRQPRAALLLEQTQKRQKEVGDELYAEYHWSRLELIQHLVREDGKPLDDAIRIAQKILDRIIFIAFCEDRGLLPEKSLQDLHKDIRTYSRAKNPAWEAFLDLFAAIDKGAKGRREITAFNGGLFEDDPAINALELEDDKWTRAFVNFGRYDFSEEVNVEVLGHLFERSITELEKLRVGGLFALMGAVEGLDKASHGTTAKGKTIKSAPTSDANPVLSKMPQSAQRKRFGIYYTPPAFTALIVERTVDALVRERFAALADTHKVDPESRAAQNPEKLRAYWAACLECLKSLTVCDPACGSGAFLIRAYNALDGHYKTVVHELASAGVSSDKLTTIEESIPELILSNNLYGVDLSHEGVEITQLALWIRSARPGKSLLRLSSHIVRGNSLVADPAVDSRALDWAKAFPTIFPRGFDCVIGNPPWEQMMLHDREFFALTHPDIATAVNAADRDRMIDELPKKNPELFAAYQVANAKALQMLKYVRETGTYPLTGKGRTNLYMAFVERAKSLVAADGMVGLLVPSGIATDDTTKEFFNDLMDRKALVSLYDFENRNKVFADVDGRFKFTALVFGGANKQTAQADFVFFAHDTEEVAETNKQRHITLTAADMKLLNPNTRTCPIFRTRRDAALTRAIYKHVPILIDENRRKGGNPWGIKFKQGLFNQTTDAKKFENPADLQKKEYKLDGNRWVKFKSVYLPLYEAKMVQAYDHRAASIVIEAGNWMRQGQTEDTSPVQHANPEYAILPRWWVNETLVDVELQRKAPVYLGYKRITSATNQRTMIAAFVPKVAAANSFCLILPSVQMSQRLIACLLGNLNSFIFDYVTRQKTGAVDLNFFIVEQLPALPPDAYSDKCPWSKRETLEHWISERVLKLSCTAEDMLPLAAACNFKGSRGDGVHIWKERERVELRTELDAAYFRLYGIERDDAEYILSTFTHTGFIPPEKRADPSAAWEVGGIGAMTLAAYDQLSPLLSGE